MLPSCQLSDANRKKDEEAVGVREMNAVRAKNSTLVGTIGSGASRRFVRACGQGTKLAKCYNVGPLQPLCHPLC